MRFGRRRGMATQPWRLSAKLVDRLVGGDRDRLLRDLRQRDARHAPRRGGAGAPDPRKPRLRHRRRDQPQHRALRPVAARGGEHHGDAGDQGRQQADPASDPVRSCRDRETFRRDPGIRRRRSADDRCLDTRSASGKSHRRGVLPGASRPARRRAVHQPSDAASRRLCHRAQPPHHRRRRALSRRGRWLDPLQLFPRPVRPPEPRPGRYHHRAAPRPDDHYAQAVRPRRHRQESGRSAELARGEPARWRLVFGAGPGGSHTAAVRQAQQRKSTLRRGRKTVGQHSEPLAHRSDPDRRDHAGADRVRAWP